jgi:hypothetical protein
MPKTSFFLHDGQRGFGATASFAGQLVREVDIVRHRHRIEHFLREGGSSPGTVRQTMRFQSRPVLHPSAPVVVWGIHPGSCHEAACVAPDMASSLEPVPHSFHHRW